VTPRGRCSRCRRSSRVRAPDQGQCQARTVAQKHDRERYAMTAPATSPTTMSIALYPRSGSHRTWAAKTCSATYRNTWTQSSADEASARPRLVSRGQRTAGDRSEYNQADELCAGLRGHQMVHDEAPEIGFLRRPTALGLVLAGQTTFRRSKPSLRTKVWYSAPAICRR